MVRDQTGRLLYRSPVLQVAEPTIGEHAALIHAVANASREPEFFTVALERSDCRRTRTPSCSTYPTRVSASRNRICHTCSTASIGYHRRPRRREERASDWPSPNASSRSMAGRSSWTALWGKARGSGSRCRSPVSEEAGAWHRPRSSRSSSGGRTIREAPQGLFARNGGGSIAEQRQIFKGAVPARINSPSAGSFAPAAIVVPNSRSCARHGAEIHHRLG